VVQLFCGIDSHKDTLACLVGRRLTAERSLAAAEQLLADQPSVRARLARRRIMRLRELDGEIGQLAGQLATLVAASHTRLVDLVGIGPILAARILGEVGAVARFPDADHFAAANGTTPIPVASGWTGRHRRKPWRQPPAQPCPALCGPHPGHLGASSGRLPARKQAEGKTKREALRCLKRRLSNLVFKALLAGPKPSDLAA
jgi:transposase